MAVSGARIDGRPVMGVRAHQTIGHLVHLALADEPRARRKQRLDDRRMGARRRVARGEVGVAVGRDAAFDVDVLLDDEGEAGERAGSARPHVERDAQRAIIVRH